MSRIDQSIETEIARAWEKGELIINSHESTFGLIIMICDWIVEPIAQFYK